MTTGTFSIVAQGIGSYPNMVALSSTQTTTPLRFNTPLDSE
jgi:hypothetical protein